MSRGVNPVAVNQSDISPVAMDTRAPTNPVTSLGISTGNQSTISPVAMKSRTPANPAAECKHLNDNRSNTNNFNNNNTNNSISSSSNMITTNVQSQQNTLSPISKTITPASDVQSVTALTPTSTTNSSIIVGAAMVERSNTSPLAAALNKHKVASSHPVGSKVSPGSNGLRKVAREEAKSRSKKASDFVDTSPHSANPNAK